MQNRVTEEVNLDPVYQMFMHLLSKLLPCAVYNNVKKKKILFCLSMQTGTKGLCHFFKTKSQQFVISLSLKKASPPTLYYQNVCANILEHSDKS